MGLGAIPTTAPNRLNLVANYFLKSRKMLGITLDLIDIVDPFVIT